jgi:hypothetical protein
MSSDFRKVSFDEDHPGARFLADHVFQLEAGRGLLALADGLPNAAKHHVAPRLIRIFADAWTGHVCFHEQVMYPLLKRRYGDQQCERMAIFERQHADISFANDELAETLRMVEIGTVGSDALAYLLRNVAERQRDHLETERSFFLPTIPEVLFPIERKTYLEWVASHPWPLTNEKFG